MPSVPSLALGSGEVTLASMTAAYAAFANQGRVPKPIVIRRVEDRDGRLLFEAQLSSARAISETTAFLMSNMLADVINAGTAAGARGLGFKLPAAGKTGTTNDYNDAWFIGYTPKLVTGVWVGFDQPRTILPNGYRRSYRRAVLGDVHEGGNAERQARLVQAATGRVDRHRLPNHGQARDRGLRARRGGRQQRRGRDAVDGLQRILRPRHRAHRTTASCIRGMESSGRLPVFSPRHPPPPRIEEAGSRRCRSRSAQAALRRPACPAYPVRPAPPGRQTKWHRRPIHPEKEGSGRVSWAAARTSSRTSVIRSWGRVSGRSRTALSHTCRFET